MDKSQYFQGNKVKATNTKPLKGNDVAPPITLDQEYEVKDVFIDSQGNQHLDLGLPSKFNYVTSYETGEVLPNSNKIHWVHPSRVELVSV